MSHSEAHEVDVHVAPQASPGAFLVGDILPRAWGERAGMPLTAAAKKKTAKKKTAKKPAKKKPTRPKPTKGPGCVTDGPKCKSSTGTC